MDLVEVDCVDREAMSAIFDFLPDRIGTFLTSYGLEVALHSIHAHGDAINERERLRVLCEQGGKAAVNCHDGGLSAVIQPKEGLDYNRHSAQ